VQALKEKPTNVESETSSGGKGGKVGKGDKGKGDKGKGEGKG